MLARSSIGRFLGLGLAAASLPACSFFDLNPSDCDEHVEAPSEAFPRWTAVAESSAPSVDFQVCDSATVDLNRDGRLDLVAANHLEAGFAYFMGTPGDTVRFAEGQSVEFVGGGNSAGVVVADFNMDGIPDIANSDHPGIVTVRVNATPMGAPIDEVDFPDSGETNVNIGVDHSAGHGFAGVEGGLVAADFNADGKLDIATANLAVPMPREIAAVAEVASRLAGHPFDNCLGNLYETGERTMGFHHDSYDGLVPTGAIAIASFGATRTLVFATRDQAHRHEVPLEHGSILLMTRATQEAWVHAVLPEKNATMRISLTFRHMATDDTAAPTRRA